MPNIQYPKLISKIVLFFLFLASILVVVILYSKNKTKAPSSQWQVRSVDTMKYSRDLAREKLKDEAFNLVIEEQVKNIAQIGATHIAIATPYDEEFLPFLRRWVNFARNYGLKVWFRGNWSGWEGWFDYEPINRQEHLEKTKNFILQNQDLFQDGDIFTACPECENGGPGDPRHNKDVQGHRQFLIQEYQVTKQAFNKIDKKVRSNFNSMNGDVAKLIMDQPTTAALGGIVCIDHYVASTDTLIKDIHALSAQSKGQIVLGEFGVPITDIHGQMSEQEQAEWLNEALNKLLLTPEVIGINYWINVGSSTQLWNKDGSERQAAKVIRSFYTLKK